MHVEPFLRWAGGKRWISTKLADLIRPLLRGKYIEPFLGSGAVFFSLAPQKAHLSDLNFDLINAYRRVAECPDKILHEVMRLPVKSTTYYSTRRSDPDDLLQRAIRFIYLNRTCYGGIYRENSQGKFNTPYGGGSRTPKPLSDKNLLKNASILLGKKSITLQVSDFESAISEARDGDIVYCDPTYHPVTREQFNRYGSRVFDWQDQLRLARCASEAVDRGAIFIVSNTVCPEIREIYPRSIRIMLERNKHFGQICKRANSNLEYLIILDPYERYSSWESLGKIEGKYVHQNSKVLQTFSKPNEKT